MQLLGAQVQISFGRPLRSGTRCMKQGGVGQVILIAQFVLQVHYNPYIDNRMDVVRKQHFRRSPGPDGCAR